MRTFYLPFYILLWLQSFQEKFSSMRHGSKYVHWCMYYVHCTLYMLYTVLSRVCVAPLADAMWRWRYRHAGDSWWCFPSLQQFFTLPSPTKENIGEEQDMSSFNLLLLKGWLVHVQQESMLREMGCYVGGRWVAKLVAHLLAKAALWIRIQTTRKNTKWAT